MHEVRCFESSMPGIYQQLPEAALHLEDIQLEFHTTFFVETVEDMESCRNVKMFRIARVVDP